MKKIYSLAFLAFVLFGFTSIASAQDLITYNLRMGLKADAQVAIMQNFLMSQGYLTAGNATGNFGPLTFKAVKIYQSENRIDPTGFVGPLTRSSMNAAISGGSNLAVSTTYLPGCNSYAGFSSVNGQSCASAQAANTLTVGQVQVSNNGSNAAYLSSTFSAPTSAYYTVRFEYTTMATGFANGLQSKIGQMILSGKSGSFSASLTNLPAGQTYYVRAVAEGGTYGTVTSGVVSFVASGSSVTPAPVLNYQNQSTAQSGQAFVGTNPAYSITDSSATISGSYDGRGSDTTVYFQYWYGLSSVTSTSPASGGSGTGTATFNLSNLTPGMTYSYRMVVSNAYGTVYGSTLQVTIAQMPSNTYSNNGNSNTNSCTGAIPNVVTTLDGVSATGTVLINQAQVALLSVRISSDCTASLKSISFASVPSTTFGELSDYKVYLTGSATALPGTFSGTTFTLTTPIVINAGGYQTITLKANTPANTISSFKYGTTSITAQSASGVTNQYSAMISGNTLSSTNLVIQIHPVITNLSGSGF